MNGGSTQHRGVVPDFIWPTAGDNADSGERAYENAIAWRRIEATAFRHFRETPPPEVLREVRAQFDARVDASPEFRYWREVKKLEDARRELRSVSLNQETREREREEREARELALENQKRGALGFDPVESHEALEQENEEQIRAAEGDRLAAEPDAFLRESAHILGDYLHALGGRLAGVGHNSGS